MEVDEAVLEEVLRRVLQAAHPEKIILFGSAANGTMTKDSDLDLLVVERTRATRANEVWISGGPLATFPIR
jgi:predicted nucleotidyltransferase